MTTYWMREYLKLTKQHEHERTAWVEREKNLRALRARLLIDERARNAAHNWR